MKSDICIYHISSKTREVGLILPIKFSGSQSWSDLMEGGGQSIKIQYIYILFPKTRNVPENFYLKVSPSIISTSCENYVT